MHDNAEGYMQCISIWLSFNSKKRMCYAYTNMHHYAEEYMHTTHISTHII